MAKIKFTKNELKTQRDNLSRFTRYLPTLTLKKQQLQMEVRETSRLLEQNNKDETRERLGLSAWVKLFSEDIDVGEYIELKDIERGTVNIVGVNVPELLDVQFETKVPNVFETPPWLDDAIRMVQVLVKLKIERRILEERRQLLERELLTTTQRVNLFEKVKIPEAEENIRAIRIFLGDEQTAAVARAKIAKGKAGKAA
jgi:V/A-type H+-transporting ATPase subunit D